MDLWVAAATTGYKTSDKDQHATPSIVILLRDYHRGCWQISCKAALAWGNNRQCKSKVKVKVERGVINMFYGLNTHRTISCIKIIKYRRNTHCNRTPSCTLDS